MTFKIQINLRVDIMLRSNYRKDFCGFFQETIK